MEISGIEEYNLIKALIRLVKAKKILEIGTSIGRGTLEMASAMEGGEICTIDIEDKRGRDFFRYSGNVKFNFFQGDSREILYYFWQKRYRFDLIYIDGNHHYEYVKTDWDLSKRMSDLIVFHDVLQFHGVNRVVEDIRYKTKDWYVCVLDYPGTTFFDPKSQSYFYTHKKPGIAIVTKRKRVSFDYNINYIEHPTFFSEELLKKNYSFLTEIRKSNKFCEDLNLYDIQMIFHIIWNFFPDIIVHMGRVGVSNTFLFFKYCKEKDRPFIGYIPSLSHFDSYKHVLLRAKKRINSSIKLFLGLDEENKFLDLILSFLKQDKKKIFIWADELGQKFFYDRTLKILLEHLNQKSLCCIRNFSPYYGGPKKILLNENVECTNQIAIDFCSWLKDREDLYFRLASPEAVFGDYVNAGHWILIQKRRCPF